MTIFCICCIQVTAFIITSMNLVLAIFKVSLLAISHLFMIVKIRFSTNTKCLAGGSLIILFYHWRAQQVHRLNYCPKDKKEGSKKGLLGNFMLNFTPVRTHNFLHIWGFYHNSYHLLFRHDTNHLLAFPFIPQ